MMKLSTKSQLSLVTLMLSSVLPAPDHLMVTSATHKLVP